MRKSLLTVGGGVLSGVQVGATRSAMDLFYAPSESLVVRRNNAALQNQVSQVGGFNLDWAIWDGSPSTPVKKHTDPSDASQFIDLADRMVLVSAQLPTLANLTGRRDYQSAYGNPTLQPGEFLALTSFAVGTSVSGVVARFEVDFGTGQIDDGYLQVCLGGTQMCIEDETGDETQQWIIEDFSGSVSDGVFNSTAVTGYRNYGSDLDTNAPIEGELGGLFVGSHGDGFSLGFQLKDAGDSANFVHGATLLRTPFTGLVVYPDFPDDTAIPRAIGSFAGLIGNSSSDRTGSPVITARSVDEGNYVPEIPNMSDIFGLAKRNTATLSNFQPNVGDYDLQWGFWGSAGSVLEIGSTASATGDSYVPGGGTWFASGTPTVLSRLKGAYRFHTTDTYELEARNAVGSSVGTITSLSGFFEVDLSQGDFWGELDVCVGGTGCSDAIQHWDAYFNYGNIYDRGLWAAVQGYVHFPTATNGSGSQAFYGDLFGFFVGSNLDAFSAGFTLGGAGNGYTTSHVTGLALYERYTRTVEPGAISSLTRSAFAIVSDGGPRNIDRTLIGLSTDPAALNEFLLATTHDQDPRTFIDDSEFSCYFCWDFELITLKAVAPNILVGDFAQNVGGFTDLDWGFWDGSNKVKIYEDFLDVSNEDETFDPGGVTYFVSAVPTPLANLVGNKTYISTANFIAKSNVGEVSGVRGQLSFNLAEGYLANSFLSVCIGGSGCDSATERWEAHYSGEGSHSAPDGILGTFHVYGTVRHLDTVNNTDTDFWGYINGITVGDNAGGFVLGFNFESWNGSTNDLARGVSLFKEEVAPDGSRLGFALGFKQPDNHIWGEDLYMDENFLQGVSTSSSNGDPVFFSTDPSSPRMLDMFGEGVDTGVLRRLNADASTFGWASDPGEHGFDLDWGVWDTTDYKFASSQFLYEGVEQDLEYIGDSEIIWVSGTPSDLGSLVGFGHFETSGTHLLRSSSGNLNDLEAWFDINLSTGSFIDGGIKLCFGGTSCSDADSVWQVTTDISGFQATQGMLPETDVTGIITDGNGGSSTGNFYGFVNGFFVGDTANELGFAAGFRLASDNESAGWAAGATLLTQQEPPSLLANPGDYSQFGFTLIPGALPVSALGKIDLDGLSLVSFSDENGLTTDLFQSDPDHLVTVDNSMGPTNFLSLTNWGITVKYWNNQDNTHRLYTDAANDYFGFTQFSDTLFMATATPMEIANLIGSKTFVAGSFNLGVYNNGPALLQSAIGFFDIDFGTGTVSNGHLKLLLSDSETEWALQFMGSYGTLDGDGNAASATSPSIGFFGNISFSNTMIDGSPATINGELTGFFTHRSNESGANGFLAGFNLRDTAETPNTLVGSVIFTEDNFLSGFELKNVGKTVGVMVSAYEETGESRTSRFGGFGSKTADGSAVIEDRSLLFYSGATPNNLFRKGEVVESDYLDGVRGLDLTWGLWSTNGGINKIDTSGGFRTTDWEHDSYWFVTTPTPTANMTGQHTFAFNSGTDLFLGKDNNGNLITVTAFGFELDLTGASEYDIEDGILTLTAGGNTWNAYFEGDVLPGSIVDSDVDGEFTFTVSGTFTPGEGSPDPVALAGGLNGVFTGNAIDAFVAGFAFIVPGESHRVSGLATTSHVHNEGLISNPDSTLESQAISWGAWNNPVKENWVTVQEVNQSLSVVSTDDYVAHVNPTPIANLTGSANYATTLASDFIGSGSAGAITQVVADMDVNFDTGSISNGNLFVRVGASQDWAVNFDGSVVNGAVDLSAMGGQLSDASGIISNAVEANLGGVFTGNHAEAFVGGFDLVDQANTINQVNGLFTIEK
ncbi:MAG: hypothetical protein WD772_11625 [Pseudohongiellaceae bacterium]